MHEDDFEQGYDDEIIVLPPDEVEANANEDETNISDDSQ